MPVPSLIGLTQKQVVTVLRGLGVTEQAWFRGGDAIPSLSRGNGPLGLPRFERQYFHFAEPIDTTRLAGLHDDRDACFALRKQVAREIEEAERRKLRPEIGRSTQLDVTKAEAKAEKAHKSAGKNKGKKNKKD